MAASVYLLAIATKLLPIGTAYGVWTGIGAAGTVIAVIIFLNEPYDTTRIFFIYNINWNYRTKNNFNKSLINIL